jgi:hypothetical protein
VSSTLNNSENLTKIFFITGRDGISTGFSYSGIADSNKIFLSNDFKVPCAKTNFSREINRFFSTVNNNMVINFNQITGKN